MPWKVKLIESGRSGYIQYEESYHKCKCYWEFGGGEVLAIISVPTVSDWDKQYPWAKGRRREIIDRMTEETRKLRAPNARIVWDEPHNCVYLYER